MTIPTDAIFAELLVSGPCERVFFEPDIEAMGLSASLATSNATAHTGF